MANEWLATLTVERTLFFVFRTSSNVVTTSLALRKANQRCATFYVNATLFKSCAVQWWRGINVVHTNFAFAHHWTAAISIDDTTLLKS